MATVQQVCDLGLAHTDEAWHTNPSDAATNPRWLAPEVLVGGAHIAASDVYAFGIVMCGSPTPLHTWQGRQMQSILQASWVDMCHLRCWWAVGTPSPAFCMPSASSCAAPANFMPRQSAAGRAISRASWRTRWWEKWGHKALYPRKSLS